MMGGVLKDDLPLKQQFDPEPLLAFIARRAREHPQRTPHAQISGSGNQWLVHRFGLKSNIVRQFSRWKAGQTLNWAYADKIAGMLGVHPAWIWPDWYEGVPGVAQLAEEVAA